MSYSPIVAPILALLGAAPATEADQREARMASVYEQVCLKAFPDNRAVEALMTDRKARELTPDEVRVTFRDDPGRAWEIEQGVATVWLELPPYHACSVRWNTPNLSDLSSYRAIAEPFKRERGEFTPMNPMERDVGEVHVRGVGEKLQLPDGGTETLLVIDQHIIDPKLRAAGQTGYVRRFVHQLVPPGTK